MSVTRWPGTIDHDGETLHLRTVPSTFAPEVPLLEGSIDGGRSWRKMSSRPLLVCPADAPVWTWLRSVGIRRPSPSGPSGPSGAHTSERATITLSSEHTIRVNQIAIAEGVSRTVVVGRMIDAWGKP